MNHTTLISAAQLKQLAASGQPFMVFDCSFDLMNPQSGEASYLQAHIPGAVYAHLDTALSDKTMPPAGRCQRSPASSAKIIKVGCVRGQVGMIAPSNPGEIRHAIRQGTAGRGGCRW